MCRFLFEEVDARLAGWTNSRDFRGAFQPVVLRVGLQQTASPHSLLLERKGRRRNCYFTFVIEYDGQHRDAIPCRNPVDTCGKGE